MRGREGRREAEGGRRKEEGRGRGKREGKGRRGRQIHERKLCNKHFRSLIVNWDMVQ